MENNANKESFKGRLNAIKDYKTNETILKTAKEKEIESERALLINEIKALKPRIDELLATGNACLESNISLGGRSWSSHQGYDTNYFITNSWSHLLGFVHEHRIPHISELGINGGGACGVYDFRTNGVYVHSVHEKTKAVSEPSIGHMKRFLKEFDEFEASFYSYVDKVIAEQKSIISSKSLADRIQSAEKNIGFEPSIMLESNVTER